MTQGPIENPVINSPYVEPAQHFMTNADGQVTGEIAPKRVSFEMGTRWPPWAIPAAYSKRGVPSRHARTTPLNSWLATLRLSHWPIPSAGITPLVFRAILASRERSRVSQTLMI
jgi:hypothetical protein